ncbi:MAG: cysteine--tRNA ligase [Pseudomonadota bacterium]
MPLAITNTQSGKKETFVPVDETRIRMYVCGPTVYNLAHIGNARPVVVFDTLYRLLKTQYPAVIYGRNITDIDDKIIAAAHERNVGIEEITSEFTRKYREDVAALNALPPDLEPHATENLEPMFALTQTLIDRGHAYEAQGHVLFDVTSMGEYGSLSKRSLEDMLAGARVDVADYKKHPGDFVLWKPAAASDPGWDSPWGRGRPGWHLECSAMIREHLGDTIDIHGGGRDLIFPHHENELAQSRCAYGDGFVKYWMHNAYVDMDGEKMSKSLGNVRTIRDLLANYPGEVLRLALLSAHYRSPLNFSEELLEQAQQTLDTFYTALRGARSAGVEASENEAFPLTEEPAYLALCDDLNTPLAISEMHALAKTMNKSSGEEQQKATRVLLAVGELLGLLQSDAEEWLQGPRGSGAGGLANAEIEALISARADAKAAKDYARADELRDELSAAGVVLEDSPSGTLWRRA